jgi:4-amino-4-deoxy-L-arabinose transferase-like glycosyltransferase
MKVWVSPKTWTLDSPVQEPADLGSLTADGVPRPASPLRAQTRALVRLVPVAALVVVALAIRWPYLWAVPQFTDETFDGLVSYGILQGKRPLIGVNAYTGAFHYYVEAGMQWLFGPSVYIPRLLIMLLGVASTAATYLLGSEIGRRLVVCNDSAGRARAGRIAGLVAGGLLATNAVHVLTNSHLAWPHCTVLLYLTLGVWLLERAIRLQGGPSLVVSGLAFGLAQQQHPTMVLLWPVLGFYLFWCGRSFFRTRWPYAALAAFLVGVSPLILYNARSDLGSLRESMEQSAGYQQGRDKDWSYRGRAEEILLTTARLLPSAIAGRDGASSYLREPAVIAYTTAGLVGLAVAAWLRAFGPVLAVGTFLLLLPLFPASHDNLPRQGRYLMPMLPLMFAGIGAAAAWALMSLRPRILVAAAVAALVLYPLTSLTSHYIQVVGAGETNARYFITLEAIERLRAPDEAVVLDPSLQHDRTGAAGTALRTFDFLLTLRGIPHVTLEQSSDRIARRVSGPTALVVADERPGSATTSANVTTWRAEEIPNAAPGGFTLWRFRRTQEATPGGPAG